MIARAALELGAPFVAGWLAAVAWGRWRRRRQPGPPRLEFVEGGRFQGPRNPRG